jgi:hypothetical protein
MLELGFPQERVEVDGRFARKLRRRIDLAVSVEEGALEHGVGREEIAAGAADEPCRGRAGKGITDHRVVAALCVERELIPVDLAFTAEHDMPLRGAESAAHVAGAGKHAEQAALRIAPVEMAGDQIAVGRVVEVERANGIAIGRAFRLRVELQAHARVRPIVDATGAAERPSISTFGEAELTEFCAGPAAIDLDVAADVVQHGEGRASLDRHVRRIGDGRSDGEDGGACKQTSK